MSSSANMKIKISQKETQNRSRKNKTDQNISQSDAAEELHFDASFSWNNSHSKLPLIKLNFSITHIKQNSKRKLKNYYN